MKMKYPITYLEDLSRIEEQKVLDQVLYYVPEPVKNTAGITCLIVLLIGAVPACLWMIL